MTVGAGAVVVREMAGDALAGWDAAVRRFPNHRVVHTRAWIASLEAAELGTPLYLTLHRDGELVGCFPGLLDRAGPWRIFGSPRAGWQSVSMGPAFDDAAASTEEIFAAVVPYLERRHGVDHIEVMHHGLDPDAMARLGFSGEPVRTYRGPLYPGDEDRAFAALKSSARRNIRRAERLGLELRFESDPRFVAEHYDQLREVYRRRGTAITFNEGRVATCFRHLRDAGNLIATSVYLPDGRACIATGMFFIEGTELSLWMWAHRDHYRWYRATEFMTWAVMRRAMEAGCTTFDLMGDGTFKAKFGAEPDDTKRRWMRSRTPWIPRVRRAAVAAYRVQQAVRGRAARLAGHLARRAGDGATPEVAYVLGDLDLVHALGRAGIRSVVAAPSGNPARYSRFTHAVLPWASAWDQPERLVETLLAHAAREPEPPVLFYEDDAALMLVSRFRDRLARGFRFVISEEATVARLVDKAAFQTLATTLKLPVPPAHVLDPRHDPIPCALGIPYPLLVKPTVRRRDQWERAAGKPAKAVRVDSPAELCALWPRLADAHVTVIVQSLIPGAESAIESYHTYVDADGKLVAEFTGKKIRTVPPAYGDSSALTLTDAPDVVEAGRRVVRRLKLRGVAKLDFKRGEDGRLFLLEVNPRFTLWHHLGAQAGLNIPAIVYADLTGRPRPEFAPARAGAVWCRPWTDWRAARRAGMSLLRWGVWACGADARAGLALDDPLPLLRAGASRVVRRLRSGVHPRASVTASPSRPIAVQTAATHDAS